MAMKCVQLCAEWRELSLEGDGEIIIEEVSMDSRHCGPGVLFVAVTGSLVDGHDYVAAAVAAGCAAVLVAARRRAALDLAPAEGRPAAVITAADTSLWPARLSRELGGRSDAEMVVAGVTGTNGKTTVAFLLRRLLERLVGPCGLLGTIRYEIGDETMPAPLTTPDGTLLYGLLGRMRRRGCRAVAMEVSSHALDQGRVADLALDVAVLTNLGRDHLDYHRDLDDYLAAKVKIIDLVRPSERRGKKVGSVVLNAADPAFASLATDDLPVLRFAAGEPGEGSSRVDLQVVESRLSLQGTRLTLVYAGQELELTSPLVGRFNVENLTAALAAGLALGLPAAACCAALAEVDQVPGRMQRFVLPGGAMAVVDYAHTPDALAALLTTCRELAAERLLVVFGCGGDRDRGKRPLMGAVAARLADRVWITSDNPRSEDPAAITAAVIRGYTAERNRRAEVCHKLLDRRCAVEAALAEACPGDLVVVAGKGHENYQLVGDQRLDLDDSVTIRDWIVRSSNDG